MLLPVLTLHWLWQFLGAANQNNKWLYVSIYQPADELTTCPGCTLPSSDDAGMGWSNINTMSCNVIVLF